MKHVKTYETYIKSFNMNKYSELTKLYKFKIGDYVRVISGPLSRYPKEIYEIIAINTEDSEQPYDIQPITNKTVAYYCKENELELVPDYEIAANKYNL